jgi:26S proteasome regulatory subunit T5
MSAETPASAAAPGGVGLESDDIWGADGDGEDTAFGFDVASKTTAELRQQRVSIENEIRVIKSNIRHLEFETKKQQETVDDNKSKIKLNKTLPYLVSSVVEVLDPPKKAATAGTAGTAAGTGGAAGAAEDSSDAFEGKSVVVKTTTRQTIYLPLPGLVDPDDLKPGELVGTNKDSYIILEKLPTEYDSRVKAMEVDEKPQEEYQDIGGCEKQIEELIEAVVLPMREADRFKKIGIQPPKGVLLWGPPGTGKTLLARACAKHTDAVFLKLAGPQLVQMFIGDGAKMIRDAFDLAREKGKERGGAIIFIDEIDAIGGKRGGDEKGGGREVQRTMLELLNQLDGFDSTMQIKVIAATNRPDVLDPALLRSGRLDRKIELPHPTEDARAQILKIHSRAMAYAKDGVHAVNFAEIARSTEDFNGAMLKAVCVEAGMLALRNERTQLTHEDYNEGVAVVQAKKKTALQYYA